MLKKKWLAVAAVINGVHTYPFWVLLAFLYAAIVTYTLCAGAAYFPHLLPTPADAPRVAGLLFETATGFLAAGGITAPLMDLILRFDQSEKPK